MKLKYAQLSSAGPVRKNNEDWLGFWEPSDEEEYRARGAVVALADGVGGHGDGEMASQLAVEVALRRFLEVKPDTAPRQALSKMFTSANIAVYDRGMQLRMPSRMCTTLMLSIFRNNEVHVGHVGDCRAYLIRGGRIQQITTDHNYAASQVKLGLLSPQEAATSDMRTRSHAQRRERTDGASRLSHPGSRPRRLLCAMLRWLVHLYCRTRAAGNCHPRAARRRLPATD